MASNKDTRGRGRGKYILLIHNQIPLFRKSLVLGSEITSKITYHHQNFV